MATTTKREANPMGTSRKVNHPYQVWACGDWVWQVLKAYQTPSKEAENAFARWFCAVKTPITQPRYDMGDTYVRDIRTTARLVWSEGDTPELPEQWRF